MISIEDIKRQVREVVELLKPVKTIGDCSFLSEHGFTEEMIYVFKDNDVFALPCARKLYPDWDSTRVYGVAVKDCNHNVTCVSYVDGVSLFSIRDSIDTTGELSVHDVTFDSFEPAYYKALRGHA